MPSIKALSLALLVIALSFSLIGCGIITTFTSSTDEVVEVGGQVPEWLQLSHRNIASEDSNGEDDLDTIDEDEAVGGADEDDGVTADSANGDTGQTEQATSEVAQAAESGSSESTQQEPSGSSDSGSSGDSEFDNLVAKLVPGTPEYNHYLQHRKDRHETPEQFVRRALKAKEEADKEDSNGSFMGDFDSHSPTGEMFSNDGD